MLDSDVSKLDSDVSKLDPHDSILDSDVSKLDSHDSMLGSDVSKLLFVWLTTCLELLETRLVPLNTCLKRFKTRLERFERCITRLERLHTWLEPRISSSCRIVDEFWRTINLLLSVTLFIHSTKQQDVMVSRGKIACGIVVQISTECLDFGE